MKQLAILSILAFYFLSCNKNSNFSKLKSPTSDNPAIAQVLNESNLALQKSMYRSLTPNEKFKIWDNKFATLLASDKLNENQYQFIENIKNSLSPYLFEKANTQKLDDKNYKNRAVELFGVKEAFNILADINGADFNEIARSVFPDCTCSRSSDYCSNRSTCGYDNCTTTNSGCGTLCII